MSDRTLSKTCPTCGAEFTFTRARGQRSRRYCSPPCRRPGSGESQGPLRPRTGRCYYCNIEISHPKILYCSQLCNYRDTHGYVVVDRACMGCGTPLSGTDYGKKMFCTKSCREETRRYKRYGLTPSDVAALNPDGTCQLCGSNGALVVDHCHATNAVRGMLCSPCNVGLGMFKDDPDLMAKAITYLRMSLF